MTLRIIAASSMVAVALVGSIDAQAGTSTVTIDGNQGPWEQAANPNLDYGRGDNLPAESVSAGFDFTAGNVFTISYLSGTTTNGLGGASYDADGQASYVTNGNIGNSGNYFPSKYIPSSFYPIYLSQLVGAFADASGALVGDPFVIGDAPVSETVTGPGATQLLLGINDDIFLDNSGALTVNVSGPSLSAAAPEPATWALTLVGFGLVGVGVRSRRRLLIV